MGIVLVGFKTTGMGEDPAKDTGAENELLGAWGRVTTPRELWVLSSSHF